jgi:hypothetical protein
MNYKDLVEGQIFNFIDHPNKDIFLKMKSGFIRIPNKFSIMNNLDNTTFPDSTKDVKILTKMTIHRNIVLVGREFSKISKIKVND